MSEPKLHQLFLDLSGPVPEDPERLVPLVLQCLVSEVQQGRAPAPAVITFAGLKARYAKLLHVDDVDTVARGLVWEDKAEAVAVIHPTPVPPGQEGEFAFGITVEAALARLDTFLVFRQGGQQHRRLRCVEVDQSPMWLDAGPDDAIDVWIEGPVGMVGSTGEA